MKITITEGVVREHYNLEYEFLGNAMNYPDLSVKKLFHEIATLLIESEPVQKPREELELPGNADKNK